MFGNAQKMYNDLTTSRPIPANDNVPQDESGASAGFGIDVKPLLGEKTSIPQWAEAAYSTGQYIGLMRKPDVMVHEVDCDCNPIAPLPSEPRTVDFLRDNHERFTADVIKWRQDHTREYRQQQGLEALAELKGYVYVGSPYVKYPAGLEDAARVASACAGELMKMGIKVYCPIAHGHAVSQQVELPRDWDFWKSQDQPLIDGASAIVVLEMRGWYDSVGLTYEIEEFMKTNKPILYIEPIALGVEERK